jgi:hypothetical protein
MMTRLHQTRAKVNVDNIVVQRGVANEDASKIMAVQFTVSMASGFHAYTRSEHFKAS